ncbi:MAG: hypothetical protein CHACPFDD_00664 [Phycisphaerae bacterium]|nr:hypothetical protein [Phycisphaerae bacterium]
MDVVIEGSLIVELKTVEKLNDLHRAQLLTYIKLSSIRKGLLLNFCPSYLRDGIINFVL